MPIMVCLIRRFLVGLGCLRWVQIAVSRICKPQVGGSIPLASSNLSSTYILGGSVRNGGCY